MRTSVFYILSLVLLAGATPTVFAKAGTFHFVFGDVRITTTDGVQRRARRGERAIAEAGIQRDDGGRTERTRLAGLGDG